MHRVLIKLIKVDYDFLEFQYGKDHPLAKVKAGQIRVITIASWEDVRGVRVFAIKVGRFTYHVTRDEVDFYPLQNLTTGEVYG